MTDYSQDQVICLICLSNNPDHQEVMYSLHRELAGRGCQVYTVGIVNPKTPISGNLESNFYVECPNRPGLTKRTFDLRRLMKVVRLVRSLSPTFVYFETVHVWNLAIQTALRKRAKLLEVVHDVDPHDGSASVALANRLCAHGAHYTIVRNSKDAGRCAERYGLDRKRVLTLDSWRAFPPFNPVRHTGTFLFFGRLRRYKGLPALLEVAKALPDVRFRVMGESDEESRPLVSELARLDNVDAYDGFIEHAAMEEAFAECDWVLVPYESASQSGIIMDAYRYSRPVIAFDVGALDEQVVNGLTGFLVESGNVRRFIEQVRRASQLSSSAFEAMAKKAYEFGLCKYSASGAAERFLRLIEGLGKSG